MRKDMGVPASPSGHSPSGLSRQSALPSQAKPSVPSAALPALAVAAMEEFMDAKIAFARMTPEHRRSLIGALQMKRDKAVARLASAIEAATAGETTQIGSTEGESATRKGDAQTPQPSTPGSNP